MALFCLNVTGQFHACPGIGTERKHLAWQLVGKGCLALKSDSHMLPWLGSPDQCSPGVWEAVKNLTDFCPILVAAPTSGFLPQQNKNGQSDVCPLWAPPDETNTEKLWNNASPETVGLLCGSVPVLCGCHRCCSAASSLLPKYLILVSLLTSWLNKAAPLLVVINASGEEKKKVSLCISSARQLVRPDRYLRYVEAGINGHSGEGLPTRCTAKGKCQGKLNLC